MGKLGQKQSSMAWPCSLPQVPRAKPLDCNLQITSPTRRQVLEPRPDAAGPVSQAAGGVQAHSSLQGVQSTEAEPRPPLYLLEAKVKSRDGDRVQHTLLSGQTRLEVSRMVGGDSQAPSSLRRPRPSVCLTSQEPSGRAVGGWKFGKGFFGFGLLLVENCLN